MSCDVISPSRRLWSTSSGFLTREEISGACVVEWEEWARGDDSRPSVNTPQINMYTCDPLPEKGSYVAIGPIRAAGKEVRGEISVSPTCLHVLLIQRTTTFCFM